MNPVGLQAQVQPCPKAVPRGGNPSNTGVWLDPTVSFAVGVGGTGATAGTGTCRDCRCPEAAVMPLGLPGSLHNLPWAWHPHLGTGGSSEEKQLAAARTLITGFFPENRPISKPKFQTPTPRTPPPSPSTYPRPLTSNPHPQHHASSLAHPSPIPACRGLPEIGAKGPGAGPGGGREPPPLRVSSREALGTSNSLQLCAAPPRGIPASGFRLPGTGARAGSQRLHSSNIFLLPQPCFNLFWLCS